MSVEDFVMVFVVVDFILLVDSGLVEDLVMVVVLVDYVLVLVALSSGGGDGKEIG